MKKRSGYELGVSGHTLLTTRDLGWEREGQEFKANFHYIMVLRLAWVTKDAASKKKKIK